MTEDTQAIIPVQQHTVDFYGDRLPAGQLADGTVLVPLRPICEALGLDWSSQAKRLNRDEVLHAARTVVIMTTVQGDREMLALPLDLLPGWLFGVTAARVKPELAARITLYRRECFRVLWDAFKGDILPTPPASGATGAALAVEIAEAVAALARQQLAFEQAAGARFDRLDLAVAETRQRVAALEVRLDPKQVLTEAQAAEVALAVKTVGQRLASTGDRQGYAKVYSELYRRYRVSSYKNLPRGKLVEVLAWLGDWSAELEKGG